MDGLEGIDLDAEFNPEAHEAKMGEIFNEEWVARRLLLRSIFYSN